MTKPAKESTIYIAGHTGMVGAACWRLLEQEGYTRLIGRTSKALDLRDYHATEDFIKTHKPEVIIDAAAKVGGIWANNADPYGFLMDNMLIQNNLIRSAHQNDVGKFIFLGSSCIYPKEAPQPLKEDYLLTAPLEPTNQWYALAKISGVKLIEALKTQYDRDYVALMPTNLYGPGDNYDHKTSHVLPALLRKFHEAKLNNHGPVTVWGTGKPLREFMHVDDLALAVLYSVENSLPDPLYNVGSGEEISIKNLALLIQQIAGHQGSIIWDVNKPDGTPRKKIDSSKLNRLGWQTKIKLIHGVEKVYQWFLENYKES